LLHHWVLRELVAGCYRLELRGLVPLDHLLLVLDLLLGSLVESVNVRKVLEVRSRLVEIVVKWAMQLGTIL
jgi:hypothetical protein